MSSAADASDGIDPSAGACPVPEWLAGLGPEVQGDVDETLLRENLLLSPFERLSAASEAADQVERLQQAMKAAGHA